MPPGATRVAYDQRLGRIRPARSQTTIVPLVARLKTARSVNPRRLAEMRIVSLPVCRRRITSPGSHLRRLVPVGILEHQETAGPVPPGCAGVAVEARAQGHDLPFRTIDSFLARCTAWKRALISTLCFCLAPMRESSGRPSVNSSAASATVRATAPATSSPRNRRVHARPPCQARTILSAARISCWPVEIRAESVGLCLLTNWAVYRDCESFILNPSLSFSGEP